ncbi:HGxxPAAW family protein [Thalassiella azotivora]
MADAQRTSERTAKGGDVAAAAHHDDHGHSVAAWTLVAIVLVGCLISSFALVLAQPWMFWAGLGVVVVGLVVGKVLQAMGFGAKVYEQSSTDPNRQQGVK